MQTELNRRDFIKAAAAAFMLQASAPLKSRLPAILGQQQAKPNIIILLFDAMSARHLSLYGYQRKTSPNFERLANRATVYHAHHSTANFTTPSTASLFTGVYPWSHRVLTLGGMPRRTFEQSNLWQTLNGHYFQAAYLQNIYADLLLFQLQNHFDLHLGPDQFSKAGRTFYDHLFANDMAFGGKAYDQFLFNPKEAPGSFFLSIPFDLARQTWKRLATNSNIATHPDGLPFLDGAETLFSLDEAMAGVERMLASLPQPHFTYIHILPPHTPYRPDKDFLGMFDDGWTPNPGKKHRLADGISKETLNKRRQVYDEFIANVDDQLGKLVDRLQAGGILDNSYLVITSDHGDMLEKGEQGHVTPLLFEPVVNIPLLILAPGQKERRDIYQPTSTVDLMPTLLNLAGLPVPETCEGQILPGFGGPTGDRNIFIVEAKKNSSFQPVTKATVALMRGKHKLIRYLGYRDYEGYEFYDLEIDPEEKYNLYDEHPAAPELQKALDSELERVNQSVEM